MDSTCRPKKGRAVRIAAWTCALALLLLPLRTHAQVAPQHQQVISANPFGLLLEWFNAEYERIVSESSTAGVGGSTFKTDEDGRFVNADVFWRFYPSGEPLDGWAFGAKVGVTSVEDETFFGYGFDANRSWLLGRNNNFYVGIGFGLKRLYGNTDELDISVIPTFRIVNIGIAF
ncbi:MAG TPA: hypothetical protein VK929_04320 [Longimicrobiales bacterium]|nr:hypothetical protein [Longimicrobiales bacterium]